MNDGVKFVGELKIIWDELESYCHLPTCTCHHQCQCLAMPNPKDFHLEDHALQILTGLNDQFSVVQTQFFSWNLYHVVIVFTFNSCKKRVKLSLKALILMNPNLLLIFLTQKFHGKKKPLFSYGYKSGLCTFYAC
ncbi:hypothetical protein MTR_3g008800 [Medicago truncatula]|uniref:Uncharacterized protein n=1 Tax=Medicago truncatula TaxID=3880 RepID=G7IYJ0_MEDTR|nr:hypothetical protein MTR_3g008800 [Medicago truncatula]